jgi:hypothetical protein
MGVLVRAEELRSDERDNQPTSCQGGAGEERREERREERHEERREEHHKERAATRSQTRARGTPVLGVRIVDIDEE